MPRPDSLMFNYPAIDDAQEAAPAGADVAARPRSFRFPSFDVTPEKVDRALMYLALAVAAAVALGGWRLSGQVVMWWEIADGPHAGQVHTTSDEVWFGRIVSGLYGLAAALVLSGLFNLLIRSGGVMSLLRSALRIAPLLFAARTLQMGLFELRGAVGRPVASAHQIRDCDISGSLHCWEAVHATQHGALLVDSGVNWDAVVLAGTLAQYGVTIAKAATFALVVAGVWRAVDAYKRTTLKPRTVLEAARDAAVTARRPTPAG